MLVPSPAPKTKLDAALWAAQRGIRVFPVRPDSKEPAIRDWPNQASRDEAQIRRWWKQPERNIGWAMGDQLPSGRYLATLDVDAKPGGANGEASLEKLLADLELAGMPPTLTQTTPSGYRGPDKPSEGGHLVLSSARPLANSAGALGPGLDIRGRGGYILGCGSMINGIPYKVVDIDSRILPMPDAIEARLIAHVERQPANDAAVAHVDSDRARDRAIEYLKKAPLAVEGSGGDSQTYKVAARLKDLGCDPVQAEELISEHWNPRCTPPWNEDELREKITHAYRYGVEAPGIAAPEAVFTEALAANAEPDEANPLEKLNAEYAFLQDGQILRETVDNKGRFALRHMAPAAFNLWFKNKPFQVGKRTVPLSEAWLEWSGRRQYEGLVFDPRGTQDPRFYNLWHGFAVEPADSADHPMVARFLEHSLQNVCGGDRSLHRWLIGFFAHLVQRPWQKPLVCLVFRGRKGTGKNALIERIVHLLGCHGIVVTDRRYLVSNFNTHLENCLLLTLDEAFWSGDKEGEGKLKGLITGAQHVIEPKNLTPYQVENLTRVCLIGNEKWLVPATSDERRFAVFEVGDGRIQDRRYFEELRVGLDERGGDAHLLRYLLDYDLTGIDVNKAPNTRGLAEQKDESLTGVDRFWRECVDVASVGEFVWGYSGARVRRGQVYEAYEKLHRGNRYKYPHKSEIAFWKETFKLFPQMPNREIRVNGYRAVDLIGLGDARTRIHEHLGVLDEWAEEPAKVKANTPQPLSASELFAEVAVGASIFD